VEEQVSAVVDRIEGRPAVLLVGDEQRPLDVPRRALPRGARAGQWLRLMFADGQLVRAELDREAAEAARTRIAEKLAKLRRGEHLDPEG
jgi:hypothetical protein